MFQTLYSSHKCEWDNLSIEDTNHILIDCTINEDLRRARTEELETFLTKHELQQQINIQDYLIIKEQDTEQSKNVKRAFVRGVIPKALRKSVRRHINKAATVKHLCCCLQEIILRYDKKFYLNRNKSFFDKMKQLNLYQPKFHNFRRTKANSLQTDKESLIGIQSLRIAVANSKQNDSQLKGIT